MLKAIGAILLFLGIVAAIIVAKMIQDKGKSDITQNTSFAQKGIIKVALDSYAGYYPLRSGEMVSRMLKEGYRLDMVMDQGDYQSRVDKLNSGDVDLAVFTVDSFILNAARLDFPGTIIAVLSESHGSDAMVARKSVAESVDDLKNNENIRISYTPRSPSHHLVKTLGAHFGIDHVLKKRGGWRVEVDGSGAALKALEDGKADVAVLWEPDISRALSSDRYVKILGTEATAGLIVDILVANRTFLEKRGGDIELLLGTYFEVMKSYRSNPQLLIDGIAGAEKVSADLASSMVDGVEWKSLYENAVDWYGINYDGKSGRFGLYQNIERTVDILVQAGDFSKSPLPDGDPRRIFYDKIIGKLMMKMGAGTGSDLKSTSVDFKPLSDSAWSLLRPVGTLKVDPISFNSGSGKVDESGLKTVESLIPKLENYPRFRVVVEGHTGTRGDRQANLELSQTRADAVKEVLVQKFQVDPDRVRSVGVGPDRPLKQQNDESLRAWQNRLSRVEVRFMREIF